jgi:hypothetical protein
MSRVYAETDDGGNYLYAIRCDGVGCSAEVQPYPEIRSSGWMVHGIQRLSFLPDRNTIYVMWDYCPDCEANRERRR